MSCIDRLVDLVRYLRFAMLFVLVCSGSMQLTLHMVHGCEPPALEVNAIQPSVLQVGKGTRVRIAKGSFLEEVSQLLFSHPGIHATLLHDLPILGSETPVPRYGQFEVTVDPQVPSGIYEARAVGRMGISNPIGMLVTRTQMMGGTQDPIAIATVPSLAFGEGNTATFQASKRIEYQIPAKIHEPIDVWCWSNALDIPAVPYAVLRDPSGREVARGRANGLGPLRLQHVPTQDGTYLLTLQEFLFRGGDEFQFVLLRPDSTESSALANGPIPQRPSRVSALDWSALQQVVHSEPADPSQPDVVSLATLPTVMAGQFDRDEDLDACEFSIKAGESYTLEVLSRGRGETTDPRMIIERVEKVEGKAEKVERLSVVDDQPAVGGVPVSWIVQDPLHTWKADRDGLVRVTIQDLLRNLDGKPRRYWLRCAVAVPSWESFAYIVCPNNNPALGHPTGVCLGRGDVMAILVVIARREGFQGAITVQALDLPPGVRCEAATIHPTQTETEIHWIVADDAGEWTGPIHIQTSSPEHPDLPTQATRSVAVQLGASTERGLPQSRLTSHLYAAIRPDVAPLTIHLGTEAVLEGAKGAKLEIPIRLVRREGGTDKCILRPQNLPPKASMAEVTLEAKAATPNSTEPNLSEGKAELQLGADTPSGEYTIWMVAETKIKMSINPQGVAKAEASLKQLQDLKANPPAGIEPAKIDAAIQSATALLDQVRKEAAAKEFPVFEPSTPIRLRVP